MKQDSAAFLDSIAVERRRRMDGRVAPDPHARVLWDRAVAGHLRSAEREVLESAREYALGMEYHHGGLTSDVYAAHPLRVAAMALLSEAVPDAEPGIVGLLHNVLEVTDVCEAELHARFGESVRRQVVNLTVDRARQWDAHYKRAYYAALESGPPAARIVKVFDKLDNLFLLGLNPDRDVKSRYAREISSYVLPMAERDLPAVHPYLAELLDQTIVAERLDVAATQEPPR